MIDKLLIVALVAIPFLGSCTKKYYDCDGNEKKTSIKGVFTPNENKYYYQETNVDLLTPQNKESTLKLYWNEGDVMLLYSVDGSTGDKTFALALTLVSGANSINAVFSTDEELANGNYVSVVMSGNKYQSLVDNTYPTALLAVQESYYGAQAGSSNGALVNQGLSYLSENYALASTTQIEYKGGDYFGEFFYKPQFALFTLFINKPSDAVFETDMPITSFSIDGTTTSGTPATESVIVYFDSDISWDSNSYSFDIDGTTYDFLMIYIPFPANDYSKIQFTLGAQNATGDDVYWGAEVSPTGSEQLTITSFSEGTRYIRRVMEWSSASYDLNGLFNLPNLSTDWNTTGTAW